MFKFKKGDKVRRIGGSHNRMKAGDTDIVVTCDRLGLSLERYTGPGRHDEKKFELVPEALTVAGLPLRSGDIVTALRDFPGVKRGDDKIFQRYDADGDMLLSGLDGGWTVGHWEFRKTPSKILHDLTHDDLKPLEVGDTVMMLDYGWGVGSNSANGKQVGKPLKILEVNKENYRLDFTATALEDHWVHRRALRLIKESKETTMAFKKKESKGTVTDYKGLSQPWSISDQMQHANKVLRDFTRKHAGQVVICGGAPRNWDHDNLANDIDVYFYLPTDSAGMAHATIASRLGISTGDIKRLGKGNPYMYTGNNIKFVFDVVLAGQEYQFIVVCKPIIDVKKDVLDYFNCDLCKVWYDPINYETHLTPEYKTDRDYKRLTYRMYMLEASNARMSMEKHVPKMMNQFPEHTVMILQKDPYGPKETQDDPFSF